VRDAVLEYCPEKTYSEEWDWDGLKARLFDLLGTDPRLNRFDREGANPYEIAETVAEDALTRYREREQELGEERLRELERQVMLRVIDARWMEHLLEMDYLKSGIGLRAVGQRDPLVEYKNEAYNMFQGLVGAINEDFIRIIMRIQVVQEQQPAPTAQVSDVNYTAPTESSIFAGGVRDAAAKQAAVDQATMTSAGASTAQSKAAEAHRSGGKVKTVVKDKDDPFANVGRNDPCPCGSGKKYKKCHGAVA
jgi:preprotein translocase subunit SecA